MRKLGLTILAATIACLTALPCTAEEGATKKLVMIPVRTAGVACALMLGTPIAIARLSAKRYRGHRDDVSDMEGPGTASGVLYAMPMGFGEGIAQGLYYGPRNAIANFDKPFSKAAMSLDTAVIEKP